MSSIIRDPRDFLSGVVFIAFGTAAVVIASDYSMGSAGRMGPGYFPSVLGILLTLIGAAGVLRSMFKSGEPLGRFALREIVLVLLSIVLFGVLVRGAGLAIAVVTLVLVSGYASIKFKVGPYLLLAVGLAVFCVLVFVKALGLPMPVFGPWLGF
ncbi:MAG TPA: tripartite tricarboxylate transporter TctB family protein [Noviherbaspirillum sp.]|nr:tripartite tricarboxylate transporter TctB family protein [Noviherbaspirillum sp.]